MEKENREHKNSVFVDLFYEDETATKNLLSLYNALHGTDFRDEQIIRKLRVEDVLYKNFKNDISFMVNGQVLVLGEHQSTINPNIPLRSLMYVGRAYEQLVEEEARYKSTQVKIPTPEFYTFYNGVKEFPLEKELHLSDTFLNIEGEKLLELTVKVININVAKSHKVLDNCGILKEYSIFIDAIRKNFGGKNAIKKAINQCIEQGILVNYLKRKGSEVRNMLVTEYSYEKDIQVKQAEARELGIQEGMQKGIEKGRLLTVKIVQTIKNNPEFTDEQIARQAECTIEEVEETKKLFGTLI